LFDRKWTTGFHKWGTGLIPSSLAGMASQFKAGRSLFITGMFITVFFLVLQIYQPRFLTYFENKFYDVMHGAMVSQEGSVSPLKQPVIVDIDEKSLNQMGQWPWPRFQVGDLCDKILGAGAVSVGVDILFFERDRTSLSMVRERLSTDQNIQMDLDDIPVKFRDNDQYFAQILARGPFLLGFQFVFSQSHSPLKYPVPLDVLLLHRQGEKNIKLPVYRAKKAIEPIPVLAEVMTGAGFVNIQPDFDGVIRRIPLVMGHGDEIYPGLALASVIRAMDIHKVALKLSDTGIEALYLDQVKIPLDARGNMLIRYVGKKHSFEYISAVDVLNGRIDKNLMAGRIVYVGSSAAGLRDSYTTPLDTLFPGVEIHASATENILNQSCFSRPEWFRAAELSLTAVMGVLVAFILSFAPPFVSLIVPAVCVAGLWGGSFKMLASSNLYMSPFYPLITIIVCMGILSLLRFRAAEKNDRKKAREIQKMENELQVARDIQMGVIPDAGRAFPDQDCFELSARLLPAREVGGDLYDFFYKKRDCLCFVIGDVSGKGVPAALFMVITRTLIRNLARFYHSPAQLMARVNDILCQDNPRSFFVTLFIGFLDLKTGNLSYANGGHNPPVVFSSEGGTTFNEASSGPIVGAINGLEYGELTLTLSPGDAIFLYTDGVTEAMDEHQKEFTDMGLLTVCQSLEPSSSDDVVETVLKKVRAHAGSTPQSDDIAMLLMRFIKKRPTSHDGNDSEKSGKLNERNH